MFAKPALLILAFSIFVSPALAESKLKYQRMEPKLDSSLEPPKPFEATINHTEIFRDPPPMRGETGIVDLKVHEKDDVLRGAVIENVKAPESSIEIVEYNVAPKFFVDYRKLEAKYAPDLAQMMKAAIADAKRRARIIVSRAEPLMNKELEAQKDQPAPKIPEQKKLAIQNDPLKAQIDQSKANEQLKASERTNALKSALEQSTPKQRLKIPSASQSADLKMPDVASGRLPDLKGPNLPSLKMPDKQIGPNLKMPDVDVKAKVLPPAPAPDEALHAIPNAATPKKVSIPSMKDLRGNLSVPDIEGALKAARDKADAALKSAVPSVNAILTFARGLPSANKQDDASTAVDVDVDAKSIIEWDKWHKQFTQLARGPILQAVNDAGNPNGDDTVKITVFADHRITVEISKASNSAFDDAISKAYRSLNGSSSLSFPQGSRRSSVSFLVDNKHAGEGRASSVKSQSAVGDKEVLRIK